LGTAGAGQYATAGGQTYGAQNAIYGNQNTAIGNYNANNNPYLTGLGNQMTQGQNYLTGANSAQGQAFNQNAYNTQQNQNAISQISGPIGSAVKNTDWGSLFGGSNDTSWNTGVNGTGNYDYFG
jgi:hypothetical protein